MLPLVIANWKMNLSVAESAALARQLAVKTATAAATVVLCPSFPVIPAVAAALHGTAVALGAQDLSDEPRGACTGEVAGAVLAELGCQYVIVGHSERRRRDGETDELIGRKVAAAVVSHLTPIICVGERAEDRATGRSAVVVKRQLQRALALIDQAAAAFVVAYEPVWAISPNPPASGSQALAMRAVIDEVLRGQRTGERPAVVYGGSVSPHNIADFVGPGKLDGVLVGAESLQAEDFLIIISGTADAYGRPV